MNEYITVWAVGIDGKITFAYKMKEQVVRCKDCRYFKPYEARLVDGYKCTRVSTCFKVDEDGFCKWGERI